MVMRTLLKTRESFLSCNVKADTGILEKDNTKVHKELSYIKILRPRYQSCLCTANRRGKSEGDSSREGFGCCRIDDI